MISSLVISIGPGSGTQADKVSALVFHALYLDLVELDDLTSFALAGEVPFSEPSNLLPLSRPCPSSSSCAAQLVLYVDGVSTIHDFLYSSVCEGRMFPRWRDSHRKMAPRLRQHSKLTPLQIN